MNDHTPKLSILLLGKFGGGNDRQEMFHLRQPHGAADSYCDPDVVAHPQVYSVNTSTHVYDIGQIFTLRIEGDRGGHETAK